jgi:hypothetical protein
VLGRDLASTIIIDNSPHSYIFHPENAVAISTFIDEPEDCVSARASSCSSRLLRWEQRELRDGNRSVTAEGPETGNRASVQGRAARKTDLRSGVGCSKLRSSADALRDG